jgi:hypothetical protein
LPTNIKQVLVEAFAQREKALRHEMVNIPNAQPHPPLLAAQTEDAAKTELIA